MLVSLNQLSNVINDPEANGDNEWLFHEILRSLPQELIEQAQIKKEFNVQLMIDNIVVEPGLLNDIFSTLDKYIDSMAEKLLKDKFRELEGRFDDMSHSIFGPLEEATKEATRKIKDEFDIKDDEE